MTSAVPNPEPEAEPEANPVAADSRHPKGSGRGNKKHRQSHSTTNTVVVKRCRCRRRPRDSDSGMAGGRPVRPAVNNSHSKPVSNHQPSRPQSHHSNSAAIVTNSDPNENSQELDNKNESGENHNESNSLVKEPEEGYEIPVQVESAISEPNTIVTGSVESPQESTSIVSESAGSPSLPTSVAIESTEKLPQSASITPDSVEIPISEKRESIENHTETSSEVNPEKSSKESMPAVDESLESVIIEAAPIVNEKTENRQNSTSVQNEPAENTAKEPSPITNESSPTINVPAEHSAESDQKPNATTTVGDKNPADTDSPADTATVSAAA